MPDEGFRPGRIEVSGTFVALQGFTVSVQHSGDNVTWTEIPAGATVRHVLPAATVGTTWTFDPAGPHNYAAIDIREFARAQTAIESVLPPGKYAFIPARWDAGQLGDIEVSSPSQAMRTPGWTSIPNDIHYQYRTVTTPDAHWPGPLMYVRSTEE